MLKTGKKILCTLLIVIMCLTSAPLQGFVGLDFSSWFASEAEALVIEDTIKAGLFTGYTINTIGTDDVEFIKLVDTVVVGGEEYDVKRYLIFPNDAEYYIGKEVVIEVSDGKVIEITEFDGRDFQATLTVDDFEVFYKDGIRKKKTIEFKYHIKNTLCRFGDAYQKAIYDYCSKYNKHNLRNIWVKMALPNEDVLYFKDGSGTANLVTFPLDGVEVAPGEKKSYTSVCKIRVQKQHTFIGNNKFSLELYSSLYGDIDGIDIGHVDYTFYANLNNEVTPKESSVDVKLLSVEDILNLLEIEYLPLYRTAKLSGGNDRLGTKYSYIANCIDILQQSRGLLNVKNSFEVSEFLTDFASYLISVENATTAHACEKLTSALFDVSGSELEKINNEVFSFVFDKDKYNDNEFRKFIEWCKDNYIGDTYFKITNKCPTDIIITDANGELMLQIINSEIEIYDAYVYASVSNNEKTIFLPTDTDYNIEIIATDDGTMDYSVTMYTPAGLERTIEYNDVPLVKDEVYMAVAPCESMSETETYNLVSEDGEEIEADYDSLPPVEDNIVDVIVAEELFDGFSIEIIDLVADAMFNMKSVVDLSAYNISTDDTVALFSAVAKYYPAEYSLIANSDFTYKIIVSPNLDRIMKIRFYYGDDANLDIYQKRVKDLNSEIDALVAKVEGMNEFEKALYIHDYIVLNCEYDLELLEILETNGTLTGELRSERYTEYSVLVNGTGICGSYALAYRAILNAAGMECLYLSSSQMNHAWNLVKIDDHWYHVDCCWDDPVPDTYGQARRTYFLRTDKEIMNLNHYSWTPGQYKANSEKYSDMPRNYDIKQKYDDGKWYYLTGSTLYSSDEYGKNETEITSISASSIDADNGNVYYSNGRYIYEYDIENDERNLVYMLSNSDSGDKPSEAYLSNIYVDNENVDYYKSIYKDNKRITNYDTDLLQREKFASITGIEISKNEIELDVFDTAQLSAKILSSSSTYELSVKWSSSNDNVVSVDDQGVIIARNKGNAVITCSFDTYIATCKITINRDKLTGFCGDNAIWELDNNGLLKISGSGGINDYKNSTSSIPWNKYKSQVLRVEIVEDINKIGSYAFYRCDRLESIDIKSKVTYIGDYAFAYCDSLKNIKLNDGLMIIGSEVFCRSGMKTITIPATTIFINEFAFSDCNWESIYVDENNSVFSSDKFGVLYNKDKTTLIKYPADNEKTSYDLPSSVKTIKKYAFADTKKLQNIIIPDSVNMIEMYAFENCKELEKISIGSGITKIENSTFLNCKKLREVSLPNTLTSIGTQAFAECYEIVKITIPDGVKIIEDYSFANCISLRCVKIGKNTSSIGNEVFLNCKALESIIIPQNVKNIGGYVFGTTTRVDFDENGNVIFQETVGCERLKKIYFDNQAIVFGGDLGSEATIYGFSQSTAEDYANRYKYDFIAADATPHNHDYFLMDYVEPNKEQDGYEYYECYCGEANYTKAIHYFDDIKTIEPTCVTDGSKVHACINCGNVDILETIPATGKHSYELVSTTPGTCTVAPVNTYECSTCGDTYTKTGKIEDGHNYEKTGVVSTCTEKGYTKEICTVCGETILSDFTSPKGHEFIINKSADYCSAHGTLEYACKNCDYIESVASDGENLITETVTVEPTCTNSGTKSEICTLCGATVSVEILNPLSHDYSDEWTVDTEPTCTEKGSKSKHCARCDAKREVTVVDEAGHKYHDKWIERMAPTCEKDGLEYRNCYVCNNAEETRVAGKLGHNYSSDWTVDIEPTCTAKGSKSHHCTRCGSKTDITEVAMLRHDYKSVVTAQTCTDKGYTTYTCSVCGDNYKGDEKAALGHNMGAYTVTKQPTCTDKGTETAKCSRCNHTATRTIDAKGHNYKDGVCTDCGKNKVENCSHLCHESGFMGFIWKIVQFFWKLFKMNPVCECGVKHY